MARDPGPTQRPDEALGKAEGDAGEHGSLDIARLVAEHYKSLYRYAYRLAGAVADAEDLTQQTFLVAQQRIGQVREPDKVRSWLFAVMRSCFLKGRRKRVPLPAVDFDLDLDWVEAENPPDGQIDGERLQMAIDELPDEFKVVVVMFYFQQSSYKEIATSLEIPMGTVMSRLSRAKSHLRRKLFTADAAVR